MKNSLLISMLCLLLVCSLLWSAQYLYWGIVFSGVVFFHFLLTLGNRNSILEAVIFIASCQWIIAPIITYEFFPQFAIMAVDELTYFEYAIPSTILFAVGILYQFKRNPIIFEKLDDKTFVANFLMIVGVASIFFMPFMPRAIAGIIGNCTYLLYVGFFYAFFMNEERRPFLSICIIGILLYQIAKEGMFGIVLIWGFMFLNYFMLQKKWSMLMKTCLVFLSVIIFLPLQAIKTDYRKATWGSVHKTANPRLLINNYIALASNPSKLFSEELLILYNARMNQGAIVSKTLEHVPKREPFAQGETIKEAILASLVPRVFWPNKPMSGGKEIYPRFTGNKLLGRTSINISPLAETYVNFGKIGGSLSMLIFGLFLNFLMVKCQNFASKHPLFVVWIPMVFAATIFLGVDFLSILNAIVKSLLFIFLCYWSMRLIFKIELL